MKHMTNKQLLTPEQVAERLQVTLRTVQRWIAEGELPSYKLGKTRRISEEQLEEFLRYREKKAKWQDGGGKTDEMERDPKSDQSEMYKGRDSSH